MKEKVLLIGLDGGTWRVLDLIFEKGLMPNLKSLVEAGASGVLKSTVPCVTAPAWTSFLTGVYPGKHGIFEFNNYRTGEYSTYFINGSHVSHKTMWDMLGEAGKKIISINVPMTYPPRPVNGNLVTCMLTPSTESEYTYPPELKETISKEVCEYKIITTGKTYCLSGLEKFVDELIDTEEKRFKVAHYLIKNREWDVAMIHVQSTDVIQHYLFHLLDESHLSASEEGKERVFAFYRSIDQEIGKLLGIVPADTLKIVMSDHGFRSVTHTVNLNGLLEMHGYLRIAENRSMVSMLTRLAVKLLKYDKFNINRWVLGKKRRKIGERMSRSSIDFSHTKAFVTNGWVSGNIYLNLEGREKHGIVRQADYASVRKSIMRMIEEVSEPGTGKKMFCALSREAAFGDTAFQNAPDIVVVPLGPYEFSGSMIFKKGEFIQTNKVRRDHTGSHEEDGIVVFSGGAAKRSKLKAHIVDVMPTVLWYSGLAVPDNLDGRVLTEAFDESFASVRPVTSCSAEERSTVAGPVGDEDAEIRDRLKSLGYL